MKTLDDFSDVSGWQAIASGQAELRISRDQGPHGHALRLDFDFKGGGGFVVARKLSPLPLPDSYSFGFDIRGVAPANKLELKLVDPSGKNVWRRQWEAYQFSADWRSELIRSRDLDFAWGPAGGGTIAELGSIELVIAAGPGGSGTVWFDDLRFDDRRVRSAPAIQASSSAEGYDANCAIDGRSNTSWRAETGTVPQWLAIDFRQEREYGGLVIDWEVSAPPRWFEVQTSPDGNSWIGTYSSALTAARRSYVYLPGSDVSWLRVVVHSGESAAVGIVGLQVKPFAFSRTIDDFFFGIADSEPRGRLPKCWYREQTYWTPVGVADGVTRALINEEGMVEVDEGTFSIEPFLHIDGKLVSWAEVATAVELEDRDLPIPSAVWRGDSFVLRTTVFAFHDPARAGESSSSAILGIRYRIENTSDRSIAPRLLLALRPFQVTPPWQRFRKLGGVSEIRTILCATDRVVINDSKTVMWSESPSALGAACFDENILERLEVAEVPERRELNDSFGYASAALRYDLELAPGAVRDVDLMIPFGDRSDASPVSSIQDKGQQLEIVTEGWRKQLSGIDIRLPGSHQTVIDALKTSAAHILINRDGPALQPGPRRYTRSWIRDGAIMGAALLRVGCDAPMRDFLRWYAPHQREDGFVPCCIDRDGVDWLVEHDSHGQLVYAIMEYYRFTGDQAFLAEMWPAALKAINYIESLRASRLGAEYQTPEKRACYGLLPESASHEGYLAHPVHSYWDDFWALRGLKDGVAMAEVLNQSAQAKRIATLRDAFAETLYASIRTTIADRGIDYIPGSVEWADFDPTATSNAIAMLDQAGNLPADKVEHMYEEYLRGVRDKHSGRIDWNNYTAYEIRIIGALVRVGKRADALALLNTFLVDRRPPAWNQWPEITWRDPTSPGHQGDLPHTWIGSEYILSVMSMFAYEREVDRSLVIGAGIAADWIDGEGGVRVRHLRTWYGRLDLTIERDANRRLRIQLGGDLTMPPGHIILQLPGGSNEITIDQFPCDLRIE